MSPPIDDLDLACFLHDRCHQTYFPDINQCDESFKLMLTQAIEQSADERCDNLMYDMSSGMTARMASRMPMTYPYPTPPAMAEASSVILARGWRELTNVTDEFPEEGTCFFAPLSYGDAGDLDLPEAFDRLIEAGKLAREWLSNPNR